MIIACPNCHTKYNLPDDKIPLEGRKVKCSKCGEVFRATPPPATPEDEVQDLLSAPASAPAAPAPEQPAASDFEDEFEKAVAGGAPGAERSTDRDELPTQDDESEDFGDEFGAPDEKETSASDADAELDHELDREFENEPRNESDAEDDLFGDVDDDKDEDKDEDETSDDFSDLPEETDEQPGEPRDEEEDEEDDEGKPLAGERLFPLDGEDGLGLDGKKKKKKAKGEKKSRPVLLAVLLLALIFVAALVTYNFGLWNERDFIKEPPAVHLPFNMPLKVPFLRGPEPEAKKGVEPGEPPTERIKLIQPVDFRQYIITNEKAGPIFVVEGKALNRFEGPKARIQVLVTLYDKAGKVLAQKQQLCGNTLSLFQLQVQSEQEITDALNSKAGIYANNAFIKPGDTTPFMVVFFNPPDNVEEYQIKIVDAREPANN